MSDKQAGQQAVSGNTDVTYETINAKDPVTPKTDTNGRTITKIYGWDGSSVQPISTDSQGRIDLASTPNINIGDVNLLDGTDAVINPATEGTLDKVLKASEFTETRTIQDRNSNQFTLASSADISAGVTQALGNNEAFTVGIDVAGGIDITLEISLDGGTTFFEPLSESPISFSGANQDVIRMDYEATHVRFTGSNTTSTTIQLKEVF